MRSNDEDALVLQVNAAIKVYFASHMEYVAEQRRELKKVPEHLYPLVNSRIYHANELITIIENFGVDAAEYLIFKRSDESIASGLRKRFSRSPLLFITLCALSPRSKVKILHLKKQLIIRAFNRHPRILAFLRSIYRKARV